MTENNQMESNNQPKMSSKANFFFGFFVGLAIFSVVGFFTVTLMLKKSNTETNTNKNPDQNTNQQSTGPKVIGNIGTFSKTDGEICKQDGKPIIRLFSTSTCPHCIWIKDTFDKVAKEYVNKGKIKAYHWVMDQGDDILTTAKESQVPDSEMQVLAKFDVDGYVPAFVFGCQYFRIGTGYESQNDLKKEEAEFRKIIDELLK